MKKMIGLLIVIFIASSVQVFATDCIVGQKGPAGGIIFFCDNAKKLLSGKMGLEVTPTNQGESGTTETQWYNNKFMITGATGTAIGTGIENTNKIVVEQQEGKYAAHSCYSLNLNGHSDWFLPSIKELDQIYLSLVKGKKEDTGFSSGLYWSSSEIDEKTALLIDFGQSVEQVEQYEAGNKSGPFATVRCIRAFY